MKVLVLSGGGVKGAVQVGILRQLLNQDPELDYQGYAGISVGALNSSLLATGKLKDTLPKLEDIWLNDVKGNQSIWNHKLWYSILLSICIILFFTIIAFVSFILTAPKLLTILFFMLAVGSFYLPYNFLTNAISIYDTAPLRKLVYEKLNIDELKNSGKMLKVGAVSYQSGLYKTGTEQDDNIKDWVMASSAFPIFFPPVEIDGQLYTDGGVTNISPLMDAINMGGTEIDVILTSPIDITEKDVSSAIPGQIMRIMEIMSTEILKNDLYSRCYGRQDIKIRIFIPEMQLVTNSLSFDPNKIKYMYEYGKDLVVREKYYSYNQ